MNNYYLILKKDIKDNLEKQLNKLIKIINKKKY